jgi:integrating conjugative element protein (TIGR03752 family)
MLVFVTLKSCSTDETDAVVLDSVPEAPAPDADTPADTIKTLTANVAAMTTEVEALRRENAGLRRDNQALVTSRTQIEENVATRVKRELIAREKTQENRARMDSSVLSSLTARVDALADSLAKTQTLAPANDIPVGLGLDGVGQGAANDILWIAPLDHIEDAESAKATLQRVKRTTSGYLDAAATKTGNVARGVGSRIEQARTLPVYTVPRNATLIGSTAMTALVGRVPVQGQVRDPMPFKIITGADNLAANGLTVPGVQGMIWGGTAVGDWTLSCVTGRLDSVTFVFDDGTIRTLSSDDRQAGSGGADEPLGWISDAQGIPCISGERKTNAPAFLTQRIGVMAIQAAAQAAAAAETTSVVSDAGGVTNSVTGETGTYVLGKTVEGGSNEVAKWLLERQAQSFDAVFVAAGTQVAIHVDRELPIDLDPIGRKLIHATTRQQASHRTRLD